MPTLRFIIGVGIGLLLLGVLGTIGMQAMESYTPVDATQAVMWLLVPTFALLAVGLSYIMEAIKD